MKAPDWFGVAVRVAGLYCIIRSVEYLVAAFVPLDSSSRVDYVMPAMALAGFGCLLLAAADTIVSFSYGRFHHDVAEESGHHPSEVANAALADKASAETHSAT